MNEQHLARIESALARLQGTTEASINLLEALIRSHPDQAALVNALDHLKEPAHLNPLQLQGYMELRERIGGLMTQLRG